VHVRLLRTSQGGRQQAIPATTFGVRFFFEGQSFDCRLPLDDAWKLTSTGEEHEGVPVNFCFRTTSRIDRGPGTGSSYGRGGRREGEATEVLL